MIFGILWTQYLSSQKPKSEALRLLGSTRIPYGIGADPIEPTREGVLHEDRQLSHHPKGNQSDTRRTGADPGADETGTR